jgi:hypothetical protein
MADQWTVKQLTEALKSFPADAKVYYEMGPNGPGAIGKALRSALGRGRRTGSAAGPLGSASSRPEYFVASGTVASSTLGQAALSPRDDISSLLEHSAYLLHGKRARSMVALTCNLNLLRTGFLTCLATVFFASRNGALAGDVCASFLFVGHVVSLSSIVLVKI